MCEQKTAYDALVKSGAFKRMSKAYQIMFEAQCKDAMRTAGAQIEMDKRMAKVEQDINEIKQTMVTKDDLREQFRNFRSDLAGDLKNSAKYGFIQDIMSSWKFWALVVIFIGALVGRGYLEFLLGIAK